MRISICPGGTRPAIRSSSVSFRVKRLPIEIAVHFRVCEEYLGRATLGNDLQHAGFLQLLDGLSREDHRGVVLPPGFLSLDNIAPDRFVLDKEPCFVEQEHFEGTEPPRIA